MRNKIIATIALLCSIPLTGHYRLLAQGAIRTEYLIDSIEIFQPKKYSIPDKRLSIEYPKLVYANKMLQKGELKKILPGYNPEKSPVKLYSYYRLKYILNNKTQEQLIKVPLYFFHESITSYDLDSVSITGDTFTFRFIIPAPQGHGYEVSLNWKAGKINYVRYTGQATAGSFIMCNDYAGQLTGTVIALNHFRPKGDCYEMYYEYEGDHFIGRGTGPVNNKKLIITDQSFRLLGAYQLRYKIQDIVSGDDFLITFDDAGLKGAAAEVPVKKVIGSKLYRR